MADNNTEKQRVQELTDKLEQGLQDLFNSDSYRNYLSTMSKFHMVRFCLNSIGRKKYFGQTDILLAALEKYRQLPYKNILRIRVND